MSPTDLSSPYRSPPTARQLWRWLVEGIWRIEHAFERSRAQDRPVDDARLRIFFVLFILGLAFSATAFEAGRSALFAKAKGGAGPAQNPAARAVLEDRNGLMLATDLAHYDLYLDPRFVSPSHWAETRSVLLGAMPRIGGDKIDAAFGSGRRSFLIGGLTPTERNEIHDLGRPGLEFQESPRRFYPLGASGAHLIGYTDTAGHGLAGAERALDPMIHAAAGPGGAPVRLAMDLHVQAALEDELAAAAQRFQAIDAAGIVVDVQTGEILALSSYPTFNSGDLRSAAPEALKNHVAAQFYEAGSVFKVFSLAAGLDSGAVNLASRFDVSHPLVIGNNSPIHDFDKGDTALSLAEVFTHSSNIGASQVAMAVGSARMDQYMRSFGIYGAAPSELAESTRPLLPHRGADGRLDDGVLAYMSFGQGLSVTPLQVATGMAAILNGGVYRPLTIVKRTGEIPVGRRVVSQKTAQTMLDLMRLNVTDPKGSGRSADVPGLSVGGKTGTAQKAENGHYKVNARVASFAAVFPTTGALTDKRYLVYILLDEPHPAAGTGGLATAGFTAAPTAAAVINRAAPFLGVRRTATVTATVSPATPPSTAMSAD